MEYAGRVSAKMSVDISADTPPTLNRHSTDPIGGHWADLSADTRPRFRPTLGRHPTDSDRRHLTDSEWGSRPTLSAHTGPKSRQILDRHLGRHLWVDTQPTLSAYISAEMSVDIYPDTRPISPPHSRFVPSPFLNLVRH